MEETGVPFCLYGLPLVLVWFPLAPGTNLWFPFHKIITTTRANTHPIQQRRQKFTSCLQKSVGKNQDELHREVIITLMTILYDDHDHHCVCAWSSWEGCCKRYYKHSDYPHHQEGPLPSENRFSSHSWPGHPYTYIDIHTFDKVPCE